VTIAQCRIHFKIVRVHIHRHVHNKTTIHLSPALGALSAFLTFTGFIYFNQTEVDEGISTGRLASLLRTYVRNVYSYHHQYIYDVILHQYQDWPARIDAATLRDLAMEILGDAQHVAPVIGAIYLVTRMMAAVTVGKYLIVRHLRHFLPLNLLI